MLPSPLCLSSSQVSGDFLVLSFKCNLCCAGVSVRLTPGPVRHLSGDSGHPLQHQPPPFRAGRHQSGDQARTAQYRGEPQSSLPVQMGARRASGDSSLRFSGEQLQLQPGTFTVVSQEVAGGQQTIVRTSPGTPVVR